MSIKLDWNDLSLKGYSGVNIYRSPTPFDLAQPLPAPLVSLAANTTTYTDSTGEKNTVYSYLIAGVKDGTVTAGVPITAGNFNDTGPGPTQVLRGDWYCGYFGEVDSNDLLSTPDLKSQLPAINAWALASVTSWHKFVYKGKILFMPATSLGSITWDNLYAAGLVYGVNGFGVYPTGKVSTPVNQMKRVAKGAWSFIVRLPRGYAATETYTQGGPSFFGTEIRDTLTRLFTTGSAVTDGKPKFTDFTSVAFITPYWFNSQNITTVTGGSEFTSSISSNLGGPWIPVLELELN